MFLAVVDVNNKKIISMVITYNNDDNDDGDRHVRHNGKA